MRNEKKQKKTARDKKCLFVNMTTLLKKKHFNKSNGESIRLQIWTNQTERWSESREVLFYTCMLLHK